VVFVIEDHALICYFNRVISILLHHASVILFFIFQILEQIFHVGSDTLV